MIDHYWDIAEEVLNSTFRPLNPSLTDRILTNPEPLRAICLRLLSCFETCRDLDDVFRSYAIDFQGRLDDLERFHDVYYLGVDDIRGQNPTPDWFVLQLPIIDIEYKYFPNHKRAVEFIVQIALHEHMRGIFEYFDTGSDWKSIFEKQLVHAYVCNRWHELGGDRQVCLDTMRECFTNLDLICFKRLDDFMMNDLLQPAEGNKLVDDYQSFFRRSPKQEDLDRIECWNWIVDRLPTSY